MADEENVVQLDAHARAKLKAEVEGAQSALVEIDQVLRPIFAANGLHYGLVVWDDAGGHDVAFAHFASDVDRPTLANVLAQVGVRIVQAGPDS